jgi:hypothetical protein
LFEDRGVVNSGEDKIVNVVRVVCSCVLIVCLLTSPAFSFHFSADFLEEGNRGGHSGSKTFDRAWVVSVEDTVEVDIWVSGMAEPLLTTGFRVLFDSSVLTVEHAAAFDDMDLPGSWDYLMTRKAPNPKGPGYLFACGNLSGTSQDGCNDVLIARLTFRCVSPGENLISIGTIPDFDSIVGYSGTLYDASLVMSPHTIYSLSPLNVILKDELRQSQPSGAPQIPVCTIEME